MEKSRFLKNKVVFFGTPIFAAEVLQFLVEHGVSVAAVVTRPDRPQGRDLVLKVSAVKERAQKVLPSVPILQPEKASDPVFLQALKDLQADLYVVVAYGQIVPGSLLSIPPLGCINVHASLLPKYRGAAPMQRCLLAGEEETGIAIQKMVKQLDAGDVIAMVKVAVGRDMTLGELTKTLCEASKELLQHVLQQYEQGEPSAVEQDHAAATYAPKIETSEGLICWSDPAEKIHNTIRAFSPRPGAWSWLEEGKKRIKILRSKVVGSMQGAPGELLSREGVIACGLGSVQILEVQPEGKKAMPWADWFRGASQFSGFFYKK